MSKKATNLYKKSGHVLSFIVMCILVLTLQACGKKDGGGGESGGNNTAKKYDVNPNYDDYSKFPAPNGLGTSPTQMAHNDIDNDQWFSGLSRSEKLCKKYLGQPQTQNLQLPATYIGGIEYLRRALFFFPDDPKQMTAEQKELFNAPCFWAGMKMRFIESGNAPAGNANGDRTSPRLPFPQADKVDILKHIDMYRYYMFTERFFNQMFNETFHQEFCESIDGGSGDAWHGPGYPDQHKRKCSDEIAFYSDGDQNDFYNQFRNTDLQTPIKNSKFVTDMEVLLVVRNIRFASPDGVSNYSNVGQAIPSDAMGMQGYRGKSFDQAKNAWVKSHFDFNPFEIIKTIKNYGEIAININRPKEDIYDTMHPTSNISPLIYTTDWSMQPNEDSVTKNIAPQVQYWGWQTQFDMFIKDTDLGLLMHETLHNMGYAHGDRNEIQSLNNAIDIPYYVQQVILLEGNPHYYAGVPNPYFDAVQKGIIPAYYNTPQFMQSITAH